MDIQRGALNITDDFSVKYPVASMIFPNKTLILVARQSRSSSSSQQMALLAGMAFIGGIVAGLLIRFLYYGIVKYFMSNIDQLASPQRPDQGNVNASYVDDNFRFPNDNPPDYVTVMTETSTIPVRPGSIIGKLGSKVTEEAPPPTYISIVSNFGRVVRSASAST